MSIVGILSRCKCESGSRQNAKAPFESEVGNALEEPELECAPGHSIDPSVAGSVHGAHPGETAILRSHPGTRFSHHPPQPSLGSCTNSSSARERRRICAAKSPLSQCASTMRPALTSSTTFGSGSCGRQLGPAFVMLSFTDSTRLSSRWMTPVSPDWSPSQLTSPESVYPFG